MDNKERGLYGKFIVERTDGRSATGEKHDGCDYFVLDLTHDPYAVRAVLAYAQSCGRDGYYELAKDLIDKLRDCGASDVMVERMAKGLEAAAKQKE